MTNATLPRAYYFNSPCGSITVFSNSTLDPIRIHATNVTNTHCYVDFSTIIRIKFKDWYYTIPFAVWIEPNSWRQLDSNCVEPVDNLTQIELLAKERNLVC